MSRHSSAASRSLLERLPAEPAYELAAVFGCGVQIIARLERPGECIEGLVERRVAWQRQLAHRRPVGDAADRKPRGSRVHDRGAGDDGEVAVPAADFPEGVTSPGARGG